MSSPKVCPDQPFRALAHRIWKLPSEIGGGPPPLNLRRNCARATVSVRIRDLCGTGMPWTIVWPEYGATAW